MAVRPMLTPSADHPITIAPNPGRVVVRLGNTVIADTRSALTLREAAYPAVQYIPRQDVDMALLARSDHASYCPYKGDASYFDLTPLGARGANAVWTYETPYAAVAAIAGHVAFYPDRVEIVDDPASGAGAQG
ncbi:MAG: DUF427 domain-containing protein [Ancalomicrobiaceae bacterium]|nr:DUF427 domain-containing protein [Ancalomicrobiaceae bacterium]